MSHGNSDGFGVSKSRTFSTLAVLTLRTVTLPRLRFTMKGWEWTREWDGCTHPTAFYEASRRSPSTISRKVLGDATTVLVKPVKHWSWGNFWLRSIHVYELPKLTIHSMLNILRKAVKLKISKNAIKTLNFLKLRKKITTMLTSVRSDCEFVLT